MAGTFSRTIGGTQSSSGGYLHKGNSKNFNNSISDSGATSGVPTRATFTLNNIKTYMTGYIRVYVNGNNIGRSEDIFAVDGDNHKFSGGFKLADSDYVDELMSVSSIDSISVEIPLDANPDASSTNNLAYFEINKTQISITLYADWGDPTPPSTVKLNGTSGDIPVLAGSGNVSLSWDGGSDGANNPFAGYQVNRNGGQYGTTNDNSMSVEIPSAGNGYTYSVIRKGSESNSSPSVGRTVYAYSHPKAPTTVKVNNSDEVTIDAGTNAILSWSGASGGSGNSIVGYQIQRSSDYGSTYSNYGDSVSGTSASVPAPSTMGESYYYRVVAVGQYSNAASEAYAVVTAETYTQVLPPDTVVATPSVTSVGGAVTLSWSAGSPGTHTQVASYEVYRSSSPNDGYSLYDSTNEQSMIVYAPSTEGTGYYYRVKAIANKTGFDSDFSNYAIVTVPTRPEKPIFTGLDGATHNPRPRVLVTVPPNDIQGIAQFISAPGWTASRDGVVAGQKIVLRKDNEYPASVSANVTFYNRDELGTENSDTVTIEYEKPVWTDDPVVAGGTAIKAAHINELRSAVDDLRLWYGMPAYQWSEEIIAGVTSSVNWATHAIEIKNQIEAIQAYINAWDSTNTALDISLPTISTFYAPKAEVINLLREAIKLL